MTLPEKQMASLVQSASSAGRVDELVHVACFVIDRLLEDARRRGRYEDDAPGLLEAKRLIMGESE